MGARGWGSGGALAWMSIVAAAAEASAGGELLHSLVGPADGDRFGAAVVGLGDLDGDGRADFALGAPLSARNGPGSGQAWVISGRSGSVLHELVGPTTSEQFGASLAGLGDVDGDGVPDFAVGSPRHGGSRGRVSVFSGASGTLLWSATGGNGGARFGAALANVGDVDGDGAADLAVGAPFANGAGTAAGRVELRSGASGALLLTFDGAPFDLLGTALAAAGDADGDGVPDLWIGAPLGDVGHFNAGSAWLRSGRDGAALLGVHGAEIGAQLGQWISRIGDLDGDGRPDVLVSSVGADSGGIDAGRVEVRSGADGGLLWRRDGRRPGAGMGPVAGIGDLDGDGRPEFLVGDPERGDGGARAGRVLLVRGRVDAGGRELVGRADDDGFGAALASLGDIDGDGIPDFAIGAPGLEGGASTRGYLRVYSGRLALSR